MLYHFEDFVLDTDRRELRRGKDLIAVEPQVFDILCYLVRHRDRVVSKDDLIASVWRGRIVSESALGARINGARGAIGDTGEQQRLIKTLPRKGIRFVGMVREQETARVPVAPIAAIETTSASIPLPDKPSIAVLPFTNMTGDIEQEYFADGMAEEILTALSRCKWLFVIARNSSFLYKGRSVDIRQVGRELGVHYVLEGSVRRGGNRVRFTGQLIDAASGSHIWADRFDGEMNDIFDLQDRFTESVVAAIEPNLQIAEMERLKNKPADSLRAYDLLLKAHQLEYDLTDANLIAALSCLKQALAIDPTYAPAMSLAAYCIAERRSQGWSQQIESETKEGLEFASRAVELGKDDGTVLWMAAFAVWRLATDAPRAQELANRSLLLNPNSAIAAAIAGWAEMVDGGVDKAAALFGRAERLNPRDPREWLSAAGMSFVCYMQDKFQDAVAYARKAVAKNPRSATALRFLAANLAKAGQLERAAEVARDVLQIEPQFTISRLRARLANQDEAIWRKFAEGLKLAGFPE